MKLIPTELEGVIIFQPTVHADRRGFFVETWSEQVYQKMLGFPIQFVQDNWSRSYKNVVRGLHYQLRPGQAKLVRVVRGRIWDVVVDLRPDSPTFGKWTSVELSEENYFQIFIPVGLAHGFCVLSEVADVEYKVTSYYNPQLERGIYWRDPTLNISWPVSPEDAILSSRDAQNPSLHQAEIDF